jgi:hypothetical protein
MYCTFIKLISNKNYGKKLFFDGVLKVTDGKSMIRSRTRQSKVKYRSVDPDPYQNVTEPVPVLRYGTVLAISLLYSALREYLPHLQQ